MTAISRRNSSPDMPRELRSSSESTRAILSSAWFHPPPSIICGAPHKDATIARRHPTPPGPIARRRWVHAPSARRGRGGAGGGGGARLPHPVADLGGPRAVAEVEAREG